MKLFTTPYYCPKCKEKLNLQWDFDPTKDDWKCVECGTWLEHSGEKEAYTIKGKKEKDRPNEDEVSLAPFAKDPLLQEDAERAELAISKYEAVLDTKEDDFEGADFGSGDDKGGAENAPEPESENFFELESVGKASHEKEPDPTRKKGWTWPFGKKVDEEQNLEAHFEEDHLPEEVDVDWEEEMASHKQKKPSKPVSFFKHIFKHKKIYLIILVLIAALTVGYTIYHQLSKLVVIGFTDEQAGTMNYEEVVKLLESQGYTNIETIPLEDLQSRNMDKENLVDMITIGGDSDFTENDRFPYDSEILIQYHSAKMIKMPLDPKKVGEKTVTELQNLLQKAGFEKVSVEADYDLILGILHKEGDVEKITVNGSTKFSELQAYRIDTEIVITYHDFKKNNKKK